VPIKTEFDAGSGLTIHRAEGVLSFADVVQALETFYGDPELPERVLWDGRGATIRELSSDELRELAVYPGRLRGDRLRPRGGKRAILTATDLDYGLSRIIDMVKESAGSDLPYELRVFRSYDEAVAWLRST